MHYGRTKTSSIREFVPLAFLVGLGVAAVVYVVPVSPALRPAPPVPMFTSSPSGSTVMWVGASSTDSSALPNTGARATFQVLSISVTGVLDVWVSDGLSNHMWGQVGYVLQPSQGTTPWAFWQVWNLTSNTMVATGSTPATVGAHTFAVYLQTGTTWAFSMDGSVIGTHDMKSSVSSSTYPVYSLTEEQSTGPFAIPEITFNPGMQVLRSGTWSDVATAVSYGNQWGVQGALQNSLLSSDEFIVGGSLPTLPAGTVLWGAPTTSSSTSSFPAPTTTMTTTVTATATTTPTKTTTLTSTTTSILTSVSTSTSTSTITSISITTSTTTLTSTSTRSVTTTATSLSTQSFTSTSTTLSTVTSVSTVTSPTTVSITSVSTMTSPTTVTTTATSPTASTTTQTVASDTTITEAGSTSTVGTVVLTSTATSTSTYTMTVTSLSIVPPQTESTTLLSTIIGYQPTTLTTSIVSTATVTVTDPSSQSGPSACEAGSQSSSGGCEAQAIGPSLPFNGPTGSILAVLGVGTAIVLLVRRALVAER